MKRRLSAIIGIITSVVFIYLAFRRVEISEIIFSLKRTNYLWVIPNIIIVILTMVLRSIRWRYLLRPIRDYRVRNLFPPVMIGFMANNILPVRLGEIIRAYSLGVKTNESRSSIFATVVIERIFDSLALLLMFWLVFLFIPVPAGVRKFGVITLILNIILVVVLFLLRGKQDFLIGLMHRVFFFLPISARGFLENTVRRFTDGLRIFSEYRALGIITFWSLILWLAVALSNYFIFMAFGMYPNIVASFILLLFVAAAVMLPSAPGFVGVFQAGVIGAFALMNGLNIIGQQSSWENIHSIAGQIVACSRFPIAGIGRLCESAGLYGISKGQSLSFSIVLWLSQYLPVTVIGLYYLRREHLSLKMTEDRNQG